ncbi:beta-hexosaminidase, partial [Clostridium perfringens]|nr:beta-hexosaminidase [Clostridium perfringens]
MNKFLNNNYNIINEDSNNESNPYSIPEKNSLSNREKASNLLKTMSLEEKVGQMFFVRCRKDSALEDLKKYYIGGYILFDANINNETKESLTNTIKEYQNSSKIKLLIGIDEEGGIVNRLSRYSEFRAIPFYS